LGASVQSGWSINLGPRARPVVEAGIDTHRGRDSKRGILAKLTVGQKSCVR
jgi:hypothetical protein